MLKRTPLYPVYEQYGAKPIDFGGWELPVQFSGIQREHEAVRSHAGLFDVSHMGEVFVSGPDSLSFLQHLTTNDLSKIQDGQCQYTLMCYPDGGVVDDLLIYRLSEHKYMAVINASNIEKDLEWIQQHNKSGVKLDNVSDRTALLALQGPLAETVLMKLVEPGQHEKIRELKPFRFVQDVAVSGKRAILSRTGYTGEDGFELYVESGDAVYLWNELLRVGEPEGLIPAGLGARDTLRFEARLPLYGQELSADISPLEAGLSFFVKLDKGDFIGRKALSLQKEQGVPRKLEGVELLERGIPRSHYPVYADGKQIGEITTGTQSPTLKKSVGLALIDSAYSALDTELYVEIRGRQIKAKVVKTPFYKRAGK
ncbi:glycine cleavage system aminomethyltransferase GcvT [Paenibacillus larvae]|uniref:Aminomethyltransferase n=1 Tax=Paenibacillus larvae subsp. larvae TaxID=147375 RepID=A0A6C0QMZ4_9BACL|nr:glycine cleavage system aminomethyltransferase GcvT [Paenibacillus larvae]QHZ49801.1 aminomethyltransferase GcvT [Paenibacillus larvae subsp. larvae]